jgi:7-carboxy-7-deazaguanine synthase
MSKGKITEIFESIQGEGAYAGTAQLFVRLFGCDRACAYCDTRPTRYTELGADQVLSRIFSFGHAYHSISFTGGEPLLQAAFLGEVADATHRAGRINYLETNGTMPQEYRTVRGYFDIVAMDFKLPSSSLCAPCWDEHREFLRLASAKNVFVKIVVTRDTALSDIRESIGIIAKAARFTPVFLQPDGNEPQGTLGGRLEEIRSLFLDRDIPARIVPQMHKLIGIP